MSCHLSMGSTKGVPCTPKVHSPPPFTCNSENGTRGTAGCQAKQLSPASLPAEGSDHELEETTTELTANQLKSLSPELTFKCYIAVSESERMVFSSLLC